MASQPFPWNPYPETHRSRWLLTGFVAGAIAVLIFHQAAVAVLHSLGHLPQPPFSMERTDPFGMPQLWSLAFWGGLWGVVLAATLRNLDGPTLVFGGGIFGALLPTLVAWFIVAPWKELPIASGLEGKVMLSVILVNFAWGIGTGAGLVLFGRSHARGRIFAH